MNSGIPNLQSKAAGQRHCARPDAAHLRFFRCGSAVRSGTMTSMRCPSVPNCPQTGVLFCLTSGVLAAGLLLSPTFTRAQTCKSSGGGMAHSMADMEPVSPPDQLPVPIKMTGIGNSHIVIKASPEAQAWFDQGLSLLHDFWDFESEKAFEQAVRVDPKCAMCFWGLAQALDMHGDARLFAKQAMAEAVRLRSHASGADKLYIDAEQADLDAKEDDHSAEVAILRKLVKKAPHDIEARIFLAGAVGDGYDEKGEPKAGQKERIAILEGVLREAPNDSAANHYWIHAMEPGNHPERALQSATLLASLAPTSGHMVHMPGHIFYRVGNYPEAERWFSASTAADERYMREQHVGPDDDWNYVHNMMYGIANLMEQGRLADANALSERLAGARGQLSATLYVWAARDQMARLSRRLPVALRTGAWGDVFAMLDQAPVAEGDKTVNLRFLASELRDFATGMQALDRNELDDAQGASARMDAGLWRLQQEQTDAASVAAKAKVDTSGKTADKKEKPAMVAIMPAADSGPLVRSLSVASLQLPP